MSYEKIDVWIGIVIVVIGGAILMSVPAAVFAGRPEFGNFTDALGVAEGLGKYVGRIAGMLFAVALIDASIIGAAAVGLSTSYALGDTLGLKHSLHRKIRDAKGFYSTFAGLLVVAAVIVVLPGSPLGLITVGVQVLAGVLLPSATVFLLLLCNDKEVLGPWVNGRWLNVFTSAVIAVLVILSLVLTVSVIFPSISGGGIITILVVGAAVSVAVGAGFAVWRLRHPVARAERVSRAERAAWRMPPLTLLNPPRLSTGRRLGLTVLRGYLLLAMILVIVRVVQLALGH